MRPLHRSLLSATHSVPKKLLEQLVREKLDAQGLKLTKRQVSRIVSSIAHGRTDLGLDTQQGRTLDLTFTDQDIDSLETKFQIFLNEKLPGVVQQGITEIAPEMLIELKQRWRYQRRSQEHQLHQFRERLDSRWSKPIRLLDLQIALSRDFGETVSETLTSKERQRRPHEIDILFRLHARACQVAEESLCLLRSGFSDAALARWRTLHEIAVVALLVSKFGEELAERYVLHDIVESRRAAHQFQKYCLRLNEAPICQEDMDSLEASYQETKLRFGKDFTFQYGWAAHHLAKSNPTFADLEEASGIDHLRPYYRLASHNVHANIKGLLFKVGLLSEIDVLLAGPSNAGLAEPGHSTALSLNHVTMSLMNIDQTLDTLVAMQVMALLANEIGEAFGQAHLKLERDEVRLQKKILAELDITQ